jgi:hypothetical protein
LEEITTKRNRTGKSKPSDNVATPLLLALMIVLRFKPYGKVLDPCAGSFNIYRWFEYLDGVVPDFCEIALPYGKDFFEYWEKVDYCIMNPPFSLFCEFILHAMEISDNIVVVVPMYKIGDNMRALNAIRDYGGIVEELIIGPGSLIGWRFGFPCAVYYIKKGYTGKTNRVYCDYTLKHGKRGRGKGNKSDMQPLSIFL